MKLKSSSRRKRNSTKSILRLPDLEHARAAVLNSLNSADAKRGYRHAIDEFVDWYCSEPRLAFTRLFSCQRGPQASGIVFQVAHKPSRMPGRGNRRFDAVA